MTAAQLLGARAEQIALEYLQGRGLTILERNYRRRLGEITYEEFLLQGDTNYEGPPLKDEWSAISLGYTSGTTGNPKGVVCHHRGAYLNALGVAMTAELTARRRTRAAPAACGSRSTSGARRTPIRSG